MINILIGHNGESKGSKGSRPLDLHEYDYNKELAIDLWRMFQENKIESQVYTSLPDIVDGPILELHCNFFDGKTTGTETIYEGDKRLAEIIQRHICDALGRKPKQNKGIRPFHEVDHNHFNMENRIHYEVPLAVLLPVFWDNHQESSLLWRDRTKYLRAIFSGVVEYLKESRDN